MDEWIDPGEKARRRWEIHCNQFIVRLNKSICRGQMLARLNLFACGLNVGTASANFILAWADDKPSHVWFGVISTAVAGLSFWVYRRIRRHVLSLLALRANMKGVLKSKTRSQLDHYQDQAEAALKRL